MSSSAPHSTPNKSPAFQFYAQDFVSGTITLTTEEVGAYILLMCYCWDNGSIPASVVSQARIARLTPAKMQRAWSVLSTKFVSQGDAGFVQPRIEKERQKQAEYRRRQSDKGKASAANRKPTEPQPSLNHGSSSAEADGQPEANSSVSGLRSSSSSTYHPGSLKVVR